MYKLELHDYGLAKSVLKPLSIHLAVQALLEGSSPGEVYVDDPRHPQSAFAWTMHRFFLAGEYNNDEFNRSVQEIFSSQIYPQAIDRQQEGFTLFFEPGGWGESVEEIILKDKYPLKDLHYYFELMEGLRDWRAMLPEDHQLLPVNEDLLSKDHLENLNELVEEMQSERPSVEAFLDASFAYCIVFDDKLVSWCLSEYNSGERCEVGIETQAEFQRRGLATITASAFVERAQSLGINQIGWHCFARNNASIATTEKVGFAKVAEYPAYWALFDEIINLAVNGNDCFQRQEYGDAVSWYTKAVMAGDLPVWVYWNTACAYAHLGEKSNSFQYLNLAVEKGFTDAKFIKNSKHFEVWHDSHEWAQIIQKLERTAKD